MIVYLASPYSHTDPAVMRWRYEQAVAAAAALMRQGCVVFSPIAHSHAIGLQMGTETDHDFWLGQDLPWLERADRLSVLCLDGWAASRGVEAEIKEAKHLGVEIGYVQPGTLGLLSSPPAPETVGDIDSEAPGSGARYNAGKPDYSMIPLDTLEDETRVWMYGERKYKRWNWMKGMAWSVPLACILRHLAAWQRGEDLDPESGLPHLAHVSCNVRMLSLYAKTYVEGDDRPKQWLGRAA